MQGKRRQMRMRSLMAGMLMLLLISMAACGGTKEPDGEEQNIGSSGQPGKVTGTAAAQDAYSWLPPEREWVYLPETVLVEDASAKYYGKIIGDTYHYFYFEEPPEADRERLGSNAADRRFQELRYCRYNLSTRELEKTRLDWDEGEDTWVFGSMWVCANSNLWTMAFKIVPREEVGRGVRSYVALFDQNGKCLYSEDCTERETEYWEQGKDVAVIDYSVDSEGRFYGFAVNEIMLWEADGTLAGSIPHDDWDQTYYPSRSTLETADGKLIELFRWGGDGYKEFKHGMLLKIDFDRKTITTLAEGLEEMVGIGKAPETLAGKTGYYDLVLYDEKAVYGYSIADRKKEELFAWKECSIAGKNIRSIGTAEDGRLYALVDDWNSEDHRIVLFTEVRREDAPPLEELVLATVGEIGEDLNAAAMRFNRYNFPCHVEVKSYETVTDLYNALLAGEPADILDLSRVNLSVLTGKGLLEDLSPYLEKSESGYRRSDFLDGILEAYTVDGILTGIPDTFFIRTVAGDITRYGGTAQNGENTQNGKGGLTLDGFLSAAEQNAGAKPLDGFERLTREELMQYLMMFNLEEFVDWGTGECRFDSAEFKRVLECLKRFPEPVEKEYEEISLPTKLQKGEVLYAVADLNSLQAIDLYQAIFGKDDVCVGFPTADGSGGHLLITSDAFGILSGSQHKETSWKFLESVINHRVKFGGMDITSLRISYNHAWKVYPTLQKTLDALIESQLEVDRQNEASGFGGGRELYGEDWVFQARHLSREEMEVGPELVKTAKPYFDAQGDVIIQIISEEVPAYYSGQKSAEEVAAVIQNRVRIYVNENR